MHRPKLFQTNQTELKSDRIEGGEAFLVNGGQCALIRPQLGHKLINN